MGWVRTSLFATLALGYAGVGFVVGQFILQSVLGIDLVDHLPIPGVAIQAIGFAIALVIVIGGTLGFTRLLSLDKM